MQFLRTDERGHTLFSLRDDHQLHALVLQAAHAGADVRLAGQLAHEPARNDRVGDGGQEVLGARLQALDVADHR